MNISSKQSLDSGLALVLILLLLVVFMDQTFLLKPVLVIVLLCMIYPDIFKPFAYIWFKLSTVLGHIASKILLSIVFFCIVMPVAMIRRLLGLDSLKLREWQSDDSSVFIERNHCFTSRDIEFPY
ncbi:MAG: membrane protein [Candidatus Magnetoglobus multicellularis str. Araruama]|uniref:Membrane protein n=1 Tax=Candidatus Magnetoglobus multicellularis str. Araruama TaxID=890399 RepID=A0A1V1P2N4_9BACT|nr:MAG: membrane protein [Candidatus Magnetoglobus multicellularis str. Araruama]